MELTPPEAAELYSEESVSDYVAETVTVTLADGEQVQASCYNLPSDRVVGTNQEYAQALLKLATDLEFPESYLQEIRAARNAE